MPRTIDDGDHAPAGPHNVLGPEVAVDQSARQLITVPGGERVMPGVELGVAQRRRIVAAGPETDVPRARRGTLGQPHLAGVVKQGERRAGRTDLGRVVAVQPSALGERPHGHGRIARSKRHAAVTGGSRRAARHPGLSDMALDSGQPARRCE